MKRSIRSWLLSTLWVSLFAPFVGAQGIPVTVQRYFTDTSVIWKAGAVTAAEDVEKVSEVTAAGDTLRIAAVYGWVNASGASTPATLRIYPGNLLNPLTGSAESVVWDLGNLSTTAFYLSNEVLPLGRGCTTIRVTNAHATNQVNYFFVLYCTRN